MSGKPAGLAVLDERVFSASNTDHKVELLDTRTGLLTPDVLTVAPNPYGVAAGAGHVWVVSHGGTLTRIDA